MSLRRAAENLFHFPKLYRAKFLITGTALRLVRRIMLTTLVTPQDVVAAAKISPGSRICELGCGDGENYRMIVAAVGAISYTGIDIDPAMIAHCTERYPDQRWLVATTPYAFDDDAFDVCVIVNVLHHLNSRGDVVKMLAEAGRIARQVALFEPLQSEGRALSSLKNVYWALTDGGSRYLRVDEFRALFVATRLRLVWESFSAPLHHFYGATLVADASPATSTA